MNSQKPLIKISVRHLIEFILRCGNIDTGSFSGTKRALEGTRIHRKIQKSKKGNYDAEVSVKHTVALEEFELVIDGRIDGIEEENNLYCIDEIKSVVDGIDRISENYNPLHWAQLTCYGYIFAFDKNLTELDLRLIYCEIETERIKTFTRHYTFEQLNIFFTDLIQKYIPWATYNFHWVTKRNNTLRSLTFPFENFRTGQREFASAVYISIKNKRNLFAKAPTGTGKTISSLFPALKAMGEKHTEKIFYLTAKTITRSVAEDALNLLQQQMLQLKYITLTAKDKMCFNEKVLCTPQSCSFAKGHYDRINNAIWDTLHNENCLNRSTVEKYSLKHNVCPFEFSLDLSIWCDVVICDYNYVFDPSVYLKRFFSDNNGNYTLLVDEAHNLIDRSREMFSAQIYLSAILEVKKTLKNLDHGIYKKLSSIQRKIKALGKLCNEHNYHISNTIDTPLCTALKNFINECEIFFLKNQHLKNDLLLKLYFDILTFLKISDIFDSHYLKIIELLDKNISVKLFCIDPSKLMNETLKRAKSSIFFSATLSPLPYYREMLGGELNDPLINLRSPFNTQNRCLLVAGDVSTKFQNREQSIQSIVNYVGKAVSHKNGNYLVFFPSYHYMNTVYNEFIKTYPDLRVIIQSTIMSESERENFLLNFLPAPQQTLIGFCVLGGLFSEGIDLKNDRLIGTIIVGVGLPQICTERDLIRNYFHIKNNSGYEHAYLYPGINKIMQAAGRVIRSENDKGIILLIDERYTHHQYQSLFPVEWFPHKRTMLNTIDKHISAFWSK